MANPTLSIIMPVYCSAPYLEDTVHSVLQQRFVDFELILVDDGSPDESGEICDRLKNIDNRIVVIHQTNGGVAAARNAGLDHARGSYIGFVDSDDLISPDMFHIMMRIALANDADIVQCSHTRNPNELASEVDVAHIKTEVLNNIDSLKRIYRTHYTNSLSLTTKVYKISIFHNLRFTVGAAFEDDELVPQLLERGCRNIFFEVPLYCYVKRENSIITAPKVRDIMALTGHLESRTIRYETLDAELYKTGRRQFFSYLKGKSVEKTFLGTEVQAQALELLLRYRRKFWPLADKYDRFGLCCISFPSLKKWLIKNEWEPIQNLLRKLGR